MTNVGPTTVCDMTATVPEGCRVGAIEAALDALDHLSGTGDARRLLMVDAARAELAALTAERDRLPMAWAVASQDGVKWIRLARDGDWYWMGEFYGAWLYEHREQAQDVADEAGGRVVPVRAALEAPTNG